MTVRSPYGKSKEPAKLADLAEFRREILERRRVLVPVKSHLNLSPRALAKIESGSDLRCSMVERYLELIGHSASVVLKRGTQNFGKEIPLGSLSEVAVLTVKADAMPNRDVARALGKGQDYFSLRETQPSLEFALEILQFLGYEVRFRLYSHGVTETMEQNIAEKRGKLGLRSLEEPSPQQRQAREELEALLG